MNKEEIKDFLRSKRGYLKEGGKRLRRILLKRGFETTIADCKAAIREVISEGNVVPSTKVEPKILFYDIEVSYGLAKAWRPGYKVHVSYDDFVVLPRIICISYKWSNSNVINSLRWDQHQNDKTLLQMFIPELNKADFIVAHNGDNFDLPWIRTRALLHGINMYPKYTTVDTYKLAKYNFNFPSNKLDAIGQYLGLGAKISTNIKLWDDVILHYKPEALEDMIKYCNQDVLLLEKVYNSMKKMLFNTTHAGVDNGTIKQVSPYTGSKNIELVKTTTTKTGTIKRLMRCNDTGDYFEFSNTDYNKFINNN